MAACRVRPDPAVGVDVQRDAGAPAGAVALVDRRDLGRGESGSGELVERLLQHLALEDALVVELDVPEVGSAHAVGRRPGDVGLGPHVIAAVRRRLEHLERLGPPEALAVVTRGDLGAHALAGNGVRHEHHATLVTGDEGAAVRDAGDVEV